MTVSGANYPPGSTLQLSLEPGGSLGSVTVPGSGSFSMSFTAPSNPGSYVVLLQGFDANGDYVAGTPARQSFSIVAPAPAQAPAQDSAPPAAAPQASQPAQAESAPSASNPPAAAAPGPAAQQAPSRQSASRPSQRPAQPSAPSDRGGSSRRTADRAAGAGSRVSAGSRPSFTGTATATAAEPTGVVRRSGEQVFAGSISRSERTKSAARPPAPSSAARPSESTANADVWSGFSPSNGPSLLPQASAVGTPGTGPESALLYGVILLGAGSVALVGGLAIAAARRRRA